MSMPGTQYGLCDVKHWKPHETSPYEDYSPRLDPHQLKISRGYSVNILFKA